MTEDKLHLIASECGLADLRLEVRHPSSEVYGAVATDPAHAGERRALKLIRGPRAYLVAHDRLLDRVMTAQAMARLAAGRAALAPHGAVPVLAHGRYSFADGDELVYQVYPWIDGVSLRDLVFSELMGDAPEPEASLARGLALGARVAAAAAAMQEVVPGATLVHRDLRPANVIVSRDTEAVAIIDLDTAALLDRSRALGSLAPTTPGYASPEEMAQGPDALGARSDVYALGVTVHQALTGAWPYPFDPAEVSDAGFVRDWMAGGGRPHASTALPDGVRAVIEACLAVDPDGRPSMRQVAHLLREAAHAADAPTAVSVTVPAAPASKRARRSPALQKV